MKKMNKLTPKQLNELKKSLHKIEFDMAVKVVNDINKILNNSSELREQIVELEKEKEGLEKQISHLKHKIDVSEQVIHSRDCSIKYWKNKSKEEKNKQEV